MAERLRSGKFANGYWEHDVILAGRYSEWEYCNSDDAFLAGKKAADQVKEGKQNRVPAGLPAMSTAPRELVTRQ